MYKTTYLFFFAILILFSCRDENQEALAAFDVYCEMVANDAKPLALHYPMEPNEVDALWEHFSNIAKKNGVQLFREDKFPSTALFASELTENKSVVLIYKGDRLKQYQQLKSDSQQLNESGNSATELDLARRFGRLLGYSPSGINSLLRKNSDFRDLNSFEVTAQISHLYYANLDEAVTFYQNILGLKLIDSSTVAISEDAYIQLHAFDELHGGNQAKSTAIAFLTKQLPDWYDHLQAQNIPIKYTYKPRESGPHDGFVAIDPGGYLLEFEEFKQHPENELFIAVLAQARPIVTTINNLSFFGSITWTYHQDMLKMQSFYENVLGYQMVADQGWTKIYQTSKTGFIGLVDERRGMENYADDKAIEIEWQVGNPIQFDAYASQYWAQHAYENYQFVGPEKYLYRIGTKD